MSKSHEAKTSYPHNLFPPFVDLPLNGLEQKPSRVPELWKVKQQFLLSHIAREDNTPYAHCQNIVSASVVSARTGRASSGSGNPS